VRLGQRHLDQDRDRYIAYTAQVSTLEGLQTVPCVKGALKIEEYEGVCAPRARREAPWGGGVCSIYGSGWGILQIDEAAWSMRERSESSCDVIRPGELLYEWMRLNITLPWSIPATLCNVYPSLSGGMQLDISMYTHHQTHVAVVLRILALTRITSHSPISHSLEAARVSFVFDRGVFG